MDCFGERERERPVEKTQSLMHLQTNLHTSPDTVEVMRRRDF